MLEHGRDTYGPQKTGLFLSALNRKTLAPLTNQPKAPSDLSVAQRAFTPDGPLNGANLQHDENLLRLLYTLSELSSKPVYRDAADAALKWFLENAASPVTHLLPWGGRLAWDVMKDEPTVKGDSAAHEFFRPWVLWDRCFDLAPEPSNQFALGLWEHQVADHETGAFDVGMQFGKHSPVRPMGAYDMLPDGDHYDIAAHAGYYIRTWAVAYARTNDKQFLRAIEVLLQRFEKKRDPKTGLIERWMGFGSPWPASSLSLAIDCEGAAHRVPEPLASRLRAFASREDEIFCSLPHDLKLGFFADFGRDGIRFSRQWQFSNVIDYDTAQIALMCLSRYENTGSTKHRDLMIAAAESYLNSSPPEGDDTWPLRYGHAISLQVSAWRHTARAAHLDAARRFADAAVAKFFDSGPLPRASVKSDHYESITGADTLALALVELHLNILAITAVRIPPNTIDR